MQSIIKHGLGEQNSTKKRYVDSGEGVYLLGEMDSNLFSDASDYLFHDTDFFELIVVEVQVEPNTLLMDEDALNINGKDDPRLALLPPAAQQELLAAIQKWGEDKPAIDDKEQIKLGIINKYKLPPNPEFQTGIMSNWAITARCIKVPITVIRILGLSAEQLEEEPKLVQLWPTQSKLTPEQIATHL